MCHSCITIRPVAKLLKDTLTLLIIWETEKGHTYFFPLNSSPQSHEEHKNIADRLKSMVMMKPGCNTSTSVAIAI